MKPSGLPTTFDLFWSLQFWVYALVWIANPTNIMLYMTQDSDYDTRTKSCWAQCIPTIGWMVNLSPGKVKVFNLFNVHVINGKIRAVHNLSPLRTLHLLNLWKLQMQQMRLFICWGRRIWGYPENLWEKKALNDLPLIKRAIWRNT